MLSTTLNTRLEAVICGCGCKRDEETVFRGGGCNFFLDGGLGQVILLIKKLVYFQVVRRILEEFKDREEIGIGVMGEGKGAACDEDSSVWFCVECGHCRISVQERGEGQMSAGGGVQ